MWLGALGEVASEILSVTGKEMTSHRGHTLVTRTRIGSNDAAFQSYILQSELRTW